MRIVLDISRQGSLYSLISRLIDAYRERTELERADQQTVDDLTRQLGNMKSELKSAVEKKGK